VPYTRRVRDGQRVRGLGNDRGCQARVGKLRASRRSSGWPGGRSQTMYGKSPRSSASKTRASRGSLSLAAARTAARPGPAIARRNILIYATGSRGSVVVEQVLAAGRRGVRATFSDEGPGIADIEAAMTDGFSTGGSLGLGLPGAGRLADEMTVTSASGSGTTVVITKWAR
jgi:serine/threonine-protein kinase RsbT